MAALSGWGALTAVFCQFSINGLATHLRHNFQFAKSSSILQLVREQKTSCLWKFFW
jgi:hypothetical protein